MLISCIEHDEAMAKKDAEIRRWQHLLLTLYNGVSEAQVRKDARAALIEAGLIQPGKPGRKRV